MTNKLPPLNRDYNRDPNIKVLKRVGLLIMGLQMGLGSYKRSLGGSARQHGVAPRHSFPQYMFAFQGSPPCDMQSDKILRQNGSFHLIWKPVLMPKFLELHALNPQPMSPSPSLNPNTATQRPTVDEGNLAPP